MIDRSQFEELSSLYPGARIIPEGGQEYIFLPNLTLPKGCQPTVVDALLCPGSRDGYATRLFLSAPVVGKGNNWNQHHIANRTWHTWSWRDVSADQRLIQILLGHLDAFK